MKLWNTSHGCRNGRSALTLNATKLAPARSSSHGAKMARRSSSGTTI
jgi:hypothetical protein